MAVYVLKTTVDGKTSCGKPFHHEYYLQPLYDAGNKMVGFCKFIYVKSNGQPYLDDFFAWFDSMATADILLKEMEKRFGLNVFICRMEFDDMKKLVKVN